MSHRRRFLNLVMNTRINDVYTLSLRGIDLHSRQNSLFYPTTAAAEDAAAAGDLEALFSDRFNVATAAKKLKRMRLSAAGMMNFQPKNWQETHSVGLSESRTVFVDTQSLGAFLYDAGEGCVC